MRWSTRAKVLLVSSALSIAGGAIIWKLRIVDVEPTRLEFYRPPDEPVTVVANRRSSMHQPLAPDKPEEWRYFLSSEAAHKIFPIAALDQDYDPWSHFRSRSNRKAEQAWSERPEGRWTLSTNDAGLREDAPLAQPRADVRVLVSGDSHTDGVCNNDESFANRLEVRLREKLGGQSVEVLNAGVGGYSMFQYFGTLLREAAFQPQVFVVAVYGGNDFSELLRLEHRFQGTPAARWPQADRKRLDAAMKQVPYPMGQCLIQTQTFLSLPSEKEIAVGSALRLCSEMQEVCSQRGIAMLVLFIPAACACQWSEPQADIDRARSQLGLSADDGGINAELALQFTRGVRNLKIPLLDMRENFERQEVPPYWRLDLHLNLEGHRLIAEALEPVVLNLLAPEEAIRRR